MGKLRKLLICLLSAVMATSVAVLVTACAKNTHLNFINPGTPSGGNDDFDGTYTIEIKSAGGLSISGVKVAAVLNGVTAAEGIAIDGKIEFDLAPAEYTLVVDESSLPAGYFVPEDSVFKTSADKARATVLLSSGIIPTTAVSGTSYALGDIMYDFSFTDATSGLKYTLSDIHSTHKAVVINFFYTTCGPCRSEFHPMQTAYEGYSDDVAIIALADSTKDDSAAVAAFRKEFGLTFYMAPDKAGLHSLFGVTSWPTTVIVDRYGAIAHLDNSGAITNSSTWSAMFLQYTSDDYSQSNPNKNEDPDVIEWKKPDAGLEMPSSNAVASAIVGKGGEKISNFNAGTSEQDATYSWPWVLKHDGKINADYLCATNTGAGYSFATFYVDFTLESGDIIAYDYSINSEADCDILYVVLVDPDNNLNNSLLASYSGNSGGWKAENAIYSANRHMQITLAFQYNKDQLKDAASGEEIAAIKNLRVINASEIETPTDSATAAATGQVTGGKYEHYETVKLNPADGYYHLYDSASDTYGALLLADILNASVWSALHIGENSFTLPAPANVTAANSVYHISYWKMSNYETVEKDGRLTFNYDNSKDKHISDSLINNYYWQNFSDNEYVPVTEKLKEVLVTFTKAYCAENGIGYYDEQWLELCYYFKHYGSLHPAGEDCFVDKDPTAGLAKHNAFTAVESDGDKKIANHVDITKIITIDGGGGIFFKFQPSKSGVYHLYTNAASILVDPLINVRTLDDNVKDGFLADFDDDISPDKFVPRDNYFYTDVNGYVYLDGNETYYLQCRFNQQQTTGKYDFFIEYFAEEYDYLRFATTGDGLWTYNAKMTYYIAVDCILGSDNKYYALNADGSQGSLIYIDFVHPQYYDQQGHSLLEMIDEGLFDFSKTGGADLTPVMKNYYLKSIYGKGDTDPLYGMAEADYPLVAYIAQYLLKMHGESIETKYWMAFACYYEHIGPND